MEATAKTKYFRSCTRKVRLIADAIRNKPVTHAIALLHDGFSQKGAKIIEQILRSAVANIQSRSEAVNIDIDDLHVKELFVDKGPTLKRGRPRAQGRFYRRLKRMSHITVVVSD
jgi:large subunit ribosomal protein L22